MLWSSLTTDTKADGRVFISLFKLYLLSWRRLFSSFFLSYREWSPSFIFAKSCCCCHLLFSSSILVLGRQQQSQQHQPYSLTINTTWHQQSNMIYLIVFYNEICLLIIYEIFLFSSLPWAINFLFVIFYLVWHPLFGLLWFFCDSGGTWSSLFSVASIYDTEDDGTIIVLSALFHSINRSIW